MLGRFSYYHEFVEGRALRVNLLTNLLRTNHIRLRCTRDMGMGDMGETLLADVSLRDSKKSGHCLGGG